MWIVQEFGGTCITKQFFEVKGEFRGGERIYRIGHGLLLE